MAANPARHGTPKPNEPVDHDLPAIHVGGQEVPVRLSVWRLEDGSWKARLVFGSRNTPGLSTADIFCASTEGDLWESVRDLREHHLRDLYRSLVP